MDEKMSVGEIQGYFRLATPLMTRYGIPITPQNYEVWYKHVSGADSALNKAIGAIIDEGKEFTEEMNKALHRQYCTDRDENELRELREDLRVILLTILRQVADLTGQTEGYESFITQSVSVLTEDASVEEIKKVIGGLIRETKKVGNYGSTLRNELRETTKALEGLKNDLEKVKKEALVDFLTGLPNRKAFSEALDKSMGDAGQEALCLLLIDTDNFKKFNDDFGHLIGDEVLRFVARKIKEMVRGNDYPARFGGEEFAVLLPQTPLAGAEVVAESIRSFFAGTTLKSVSTSRSLGKITVSIGLACYHQGETAEQLINRSDQTLYHAKKTGKNRVVTEADPMYNRRGRKHIGLAGVVDGGG